MACIFFIMWSIKVSFTFFHFILSLASFINLKKTSLAWNNRIRQMGCHTHDSFTTVGDDMTGSAGRNAMDECINSTPYSEG